MTRAPMGEWHNMTRGPAQLQPTVPDVSSLRGLSRSPSRRHCQLNFATFQPLPPIIYLPHKYITCNQHVQAPPASCRDYQPVCLTVFRFLHELPR